MDLSWENPRVDPPQGFRVNEPVWLAEVFFGSSNWRQAFEGSGYLGEVGFRLLEWNFEMLDLWNFNLLKIHPVHASKNKRKNCWWGCFSYLFPFFAYESRMILAVFKSRSRKHQTKKCKKKKNIKNHNICQTFNLLDNKQFCPLYFFSEPKKNRATKKTGEQFLHVPTFHLSNRGIENAGRLPGGCKRPKALGIGPLSVLFHKLNISKDSKSPKALAVWKKNRNHAVEKKNGYLCTWIFHFVCKMCAEIHPQKPFNNKAEHLHIWKIQV